MLYLFCSIDGSEDLFLSFTAWRYEGVRSVLPQMSAHSTRVWGETATGTGEEQGGVGGGVDFLSFNLTDRWGAT